jgi:hypothetical protein
MVQPVSALVEDPVPRELEISGFGHLEEVLQSECFKRATTLRSLLLFLWKNRGKEISEYAARHQVRDGAGERESMEILSGETLGRPKSFTPSRRDVTFTVIYQNMGPLHAVVVPSGTGPSPASVGLTAFFLAITSYHPYASSGSLDRPVGRPLSVHTGRSLPHP